jgi:hypothetical protein
VSDEAAFQARRAVMAAIEKESTDRTGLKSTVVTLYQGGQYHLYRYRKYTDVRLVFAPEEQIAFYGGDPDNFEYPRFDFDVCFFRAYENGQPARTSHYLKWSKTGPAENDLVFVSGNPGRTDRLRTIAELEALRDREIPRTLERLARLEVLLSSYSARSQENARRARTDLFGIKNSRKARNGALAGLLNPKLMEQKKAAEQQFRAAVSANPALAEAQGGWDRIAQAQKAIAEQTVEYDLLERGQAFNSCARLRSSPSRTASASRNTVSQPAARSSCSFWLSSRFTMTSKPLSWPTRSPGWSRASVGLILSSRESSPANHPANAPPQRCAVPSWLRLPCGGSCIKVGRRLSAEPMTR